MKTDRRHLVCEKYLFSDLVDLDHIRGLFQNFQNVTGYFAGVYELSSQNYTVPCCWRNVCVRFHQNCPATAALCEKSNRKRNALLEKNRCITFVECENGMIDGGAPVIVDGVHVANVCSGQVLFEQPDLDRFAEQGKKYGFDTAAYLQSVRDVPIVKREDFENALHFLGSITATLAEKGLANLKGREVLRSVQTSEAKFRGLTESITDIVWTTDMDLRLTFISPSVQEIRGFTVAESDDPEPG